MFWNPQLRKLGKDGLEIMTTCVADLAVSAKSVSVRELLLKIKIGKTYE